MTHRSQKRLKKRFNTKQMKVLNYLTDHPEAKDKVLCEHANISDRTLYRWKQDPVFIDELVDRARRVLKNKLPKVYKKLSSEAEDGNFQHIRILLQHMEKLEELRAASRENTLTFQWDMEEGDESQTD